MIPLQKGPKYWIEKNAKRFVYPPNVEQMDGFVSVTFSGLNPNLMLRILETGQADAFLYLSVGPPDIDSEDEIVDIVYDDIITIKTDAGGRFYCGVCPGFCGIYSDPKYYSTPDELWVAHTLDDIVEWINSFRQDECYLFYVNKGARGADRIKKSDAENIKEWPACACIPIVTSF
ncbi:hypothetical protein [Marinobacterium sediminicola]|uniref:Uncharacterized protein n=1 Tax=Marinobacterium sediminicola TaxID=518898 RepID=A0ABY1S2K5_9GAMM|nr:hypothetical protein [Marinobacterium sediminicola]ULG68545.1 hypothetical protein LN244_12680 [Marinobacterium sediminicola]SMR76596.1 hypothetical protein SAMN04487964_1129 [Marinobacterium sediminicola]